MDQNIQDPLDDETVAQLAELETRAETEDVVDQLREIVNAPTEHWAAALTDRELAEINFAHVYATQFNHGTSGHNRLLLIAKLAETLDKAGATTPPPPAPAGDPERVLIPVPYHSQWETDALLTRKDCGPACVEMIGEFLRPATDYTTDHIMKRITGGADRSIYIRELQRVALELYQVTLHRFDGADFEDLNGWIDAGLPVIVLVHYGSFLTRMDRNYTGGHYMVVMGYDRVSYQTKTEGELVHRWILHDPDFYEKDTLAQGACIPIVHDHFAQMWNDAVKDGNPVRMALVPEAN